MMEGEMIMYCQRMLMLMLISIVAVTACQTTTNQHESEVSLFLERYANGYRPTKIADVSTLNLSNSSVTDDDLATLHYFRNSLKRLNLSNTAITDAGLKHVIDLFRLQDLDVSHTLVTDPGIVSLGCLDRLDRIDVSFTNVSVNGIAELQAQNPNLSVLNVH